jgi:hypothetical protein
MIMIYGIAVGTAFFAVLPRFMRGYSGNSSSRFVIGLRANNALLQPWDCNNYVVKFFLE